MFPPILETSQQIVTISILNLFLFAKHAVFGKYDKHVDPSVGGNIATDRNNLIFILFLFANMLYIFGKYDECV